MPPLAPIFGAIVAGISSAVSAISGLVGGWAGLWGFLTSPIGSLILGIGIQLISRLFIRRPDAPSIEAGKINVRIPEPERWVDAGQIRQGGGVLFAEFDSKGNFWYLVVHSDSIATEIVKYYFDDIELTLNASGEVINNEFTLDNDFNEYKGSGTQRIYFTIFTTTYDHSNPVPPAIAELQAAFPTLWTSDHKLVGTTYSVVKVNAINIQHRYKVFKWRGSVGLGEPSLSVVAKWSQVYDPRDITQDLNDKTTWKFSKNSALVWAWFRTLKRGRGKSLDSINWDMVAEQADICDQNVTSVYEGTVKRYECSTAIPESKERNVAEQEILLSCDGQLVFDDDGKCWPRVGYHYSPTLSLVRNRDIAAMESVEAQNGESETQGVIVRYLDPGAKYTKQPAAAWINPLYYVEGETPKFLAIDALTIQNHNQAMRIAKAIGYRSQPEHKLVPTVSLRGLKARQERIFNLSYDNVFAGEYEIITPVEVDEIGIFCGFGCVPVDANRWDLVAGEERPKPVFEDSETGVSLALPTGVSITYANNRLEATFDPAIRNDVNYDFQWSLDPLAADIDWTNFVFVSMSDQFAYSGGVPQNETYYVRYRTRSAGGKTSDWSDPPISVVATVLELTGTPVTTGQVSVAYTGFTIGVSGGNPPYLFVDLYGRLPPGITIDLATGEISGTPTNDGTFADILIRVSDDTGNYNNFPTFTITIDP